MPRKSKTEICRCRCDHCLKDSAQGLLIPVHTFSIHRRQQQIRNAFSSAGAGTNPDSSLDSDADVADTEQEAHDTETARDVPPEDRSTIPDAEYLLSLEADIDVQLATLYSEGTLEFLHDPSPDMPFQYPDPTTIPLFNSGHFSLKTNKACNRRFLEIESYICDLWQQMEKLPPQGRSERLEDSLHHALITIQRMKNKHWLDQAYPSGPFGRSFNNCMLLYYIGCFTTEY